MRVLLLAAAVWLAGCADGEAGARREGKIRVVATTGMVADLARHVGGDIVEVTALMGAGIDPHLYRATASDLDRLKAADLVLYNGKGLEGKLGDVFVKLARIKEVVAVTDGIDDSRLIEPEELEGHYDPHVWFDVALWAEGVDPVAKALARLDPEHAGEFAKRAASYKTDLLALDNEVRATLATVPKPQRVLITSHDAFRYLGRAYDMEVRGLQGISTVQDAGVKDVQDMAAFIVERKIKAIFVETSVNARAIKAVQEAVKRKGGSAAIGGELFSDAMGDHDPVDTYIGMVRANVDTIVKALK